MTYRCALCRKWWLRPDPPVTCTVYHSGGCCHFGESEVPAPERMADRLRRMAAGYFG